MRRYARHCAIVFATIVIISGITGSLCSAGEQAGEVTMADLARRLQALEERLVKLEGRLQALEKEPPAQAKAPEERPVIEIVSPKKDAEVGMVVSVEGIVRLQDLGDRFPVVLQHPIMTNLLWVQPLPVKVEKVAEGYRFRCRAYCGTAQQGIGEKFELYAILPKKGAHNEGDQLDEIPEGVLTSPSVLVTRTQK